MGRTRRAVIGIAGGWSPMGKLRPMHVPALRRKFVLICARHPPISPFWHILPVEKSRAYLFSNNRICRALTLGAFHLRFSAACGARRDSRATTPPNTDHSLGTPGSASLPCALSYVPELPKPFSSLAEPSRLSTSWTRPVRTGTGTIWATFSPAAIVTGVSLRFVITIKISPL